MLPYLAVAAAGLAVAGILALATEAEAQAQSRWEHAHRRATDELRRHRRDIKRQMEEQQDRQTFYQLNGQYYASVQAANAAYGLLKDCRLMTACLKKQINAVDSKRLALKHSLSQHPTAADKSAMIEELRQLRAFRQGLCDQHQQVQLQKQAMYEELTRLNQQTEALKNAIATRCGNKGRDWHARLQQRTAERPFKA